MSLGHDAQVAAHGGCLRGRQFDPTFTMREKVTEMTKNSSCMGCHATINPLGFALENYDAIGPLAHEG